MDFLPTKNRAISWSEACHGRPLALTQQFESTESVRERIVCSNLIITRSASCNWVPEIKNFYQKFGKNHRLVCGELEENLQTYRKICIADEKKYC